MADQQLEIKVVKNSDELLKTFLVRSIVYMHEQNCPYEEEFDQNDFAATQILGTLGNEPVLTARIRYFDSFAKLERLAVRSQFRGHGYGHQLLRFMLELCLRKGFKTIYLHANASLQSFYEGYGFRPVRERFGFSDYDYIEMVLALESNPVESVGLEHHPIVLNRPEGDWDVEGPIERSLERMASYRSPSKAG